MFRIGNGKVLVILLVIVIIYNLVMLNTYMLGFSVFSYSECLVSANGYFLLRTNTRQILKRRRKLLELASRKSWRPQNPSRRPLLMKLPD